MKNEEPIFSSSGSSSDVDEEADADEQCPICFVRLKGTREIGTPECCDHAFCAACIQEWSKNVNTCPIDRCKFSIVFVRKGLNGPLIRRLTVDDIKNADDEDDLTLCQICGHGNDESSLLLCDGCDRGFHLYCLRPPLDSVPLNDWFCRQCLPNQNQNESGASASAPGTGRGVQRRILPRTRAVERVRDRIVQNQLAFQSLEDEDEEEGSVVTSSEAESEEDDSDEGDSEEDSAQKNGQRYFAGGSLENVIAGVADGSLGDSVSLVPTNNSYGAAALRPRKAKTTHRRRRKRRVTKKKTGGVKKSTRSKPRAKKRKTGRGRKKGRGRRRRFQRRAQFAKESVKGRIAKVLGLSAPTKGRTLPRVRLPGQETSLQAVGVNLFGDRNEILGFDDSSRSSSERSETEQVSVKAELFDMPLSERLKIIRRGNGKVQVEPEKLSSGGPSKVDRLRKDTSCSSRDVGNEPKSDGGIFGILSSISLLHSPSTRVSIKRDGSVCSQTTASPTLFNNTTSSNNMAPPVRLKRPGPGPPSRHPPPPMLDPTRGPRPLFSRFGGPPVPRPVRPPPRPVSAPRNGGPRSLLNPMMRHQQPSGPFPRGPRPKGPPQQFPPSMDFPDFPPAPRPPFLGPGSGPPDQGFGHSEHGFGPPEHGFGPPEHGFGPPEHGFGSPEHGFAPPEHGFGPPEPGFNPQEPMFTPQELGFHPPEHGFGPLMPPHLPDMGMPPIGPGSEMGMPVSTGADVLPPPPFPPLPDFLAQAGSLETPSAVGVSLPPPPELPKTIPDIPLPSGSAEKPSQVDPYSQDGEAYVPENPIDDDDDFDPAPKAKPETNGEPKVPGERIVEWMSTGGSSSAEMMGKEISNAPSGLGDKSILKSSGGSKTSISKAMLKSWIKTEKKEPQTGQTATSAEKKSGASLAADPKKLRKEHFEQVQTTLELEKQAKKLARESLRMKTSTITLNTSSNKGGEVPPPPEPPKEPSQPSETEVHPPEPVLPKKPPSEINSDNKGKDRDRNKSRSAWSRSRSRSRERPRRDETRRGDRDHGPRRSGDHRRDRSRDHRDRSRDRSGRTKDARSSKSESSKLPETDDHRHSKAKPVEGAEFEPGKLKPVLTESDKPDEPKEPEKEPKSEPTEPLSQKSETDYSKPETSGNQKEVQPGPELLAKQPTTERRSKSRERKHLAGSSESRRQKPDEDRSKRSRKSRERSREKESKRDEEISKSTRRSREGGLEAVKTEDTEPKEKERSSKRSRERAPRERSREPESRSSQRSREPQRKEEPRNRSSRDLEPKPLLEQSVPKEEPRDGSREREPKSRDKENKSGSEHRSRDRAGYKAEAQEQRSRSKERRDKGSRDRDGHFNRSGGTNQIRPLLTPSPSPPPPPPPLLKRLASRSPPPPPPPLLKQRERGSSGMFPVYPKSEKDEREMSNSRKRSPPSPPPKPLGDRHGKRAKVAEPSAGGHTRESGSRSRRDKERDKKRPSSPGARKREKERSVSPKKESLEPEKYDERTPPPPPKPKSPEVDIHAELTPETVESMKKELGEIEQKLFEQRRKRKKAEEKSRKKLGKRSKDSSPDESADEDEKKAAKKQRKKEKKGKKAKKKDKRKSKSSAEGSKTAPSDGAAPGSDLEVVDETTASASPPDPAGGVAMKTTQDEEMAPADPTSPGATADQRHIEQLPDTSGDQLYDDLFVGGSGSTPTTSPAKLTSAVSAEPTEALIANSEKLANILDSVGLNPSQLKPEILKELRKKIEEGPPEASGVGSSGDGSLTESFADILSNLSANAPPELPRGSGGGKPVEYTYPSPGSEEMKTVDEMLDSTAASHPKKAFLRREQLLQQQRQQQQQTGHQHASHESRRFSVAEVSSTTSDARSDRHNKLSTKIDHQMEVEDVVKNILKPYYVGHQITRDDYRDIMKKTVPEICKKSKSNTINMEKVRRFVEAYVERTQRKHAEALQFAKGELGLG